MEEALSTCPFTLISPPGTNSIPRKFWMSLMPVGCPSPLSIRVILTVVLDIQGIDQLIEKFRNSSVMDQDPAYRPKVDCHICDSWHLSNLSSQLFHSSGPLAGMEAEFPPPNNILKKCRSVTAAQQIGR